MDEVTSPAPTEMAAEVTAPAPIEMEAEVTAQESEKNVEVALLETPSPPEGVSCAPSSAPAAAPPSQITAATSAHQSAKGRGGLFSCLPCFSADQEAD